MRSQRIAKLEVEVAKLATTVKTALDGHRYRHESVPLRELFDATSRNGWRPIASAPRDRWIYVWAPPINGLPGLVWISIWHPDVGFRVDEFRDVTMWQPLILPAPPPFDPDD